MKINAFALLQEQEQSGKLVAKPLPATDPLKIYWSGIAYRFGGARFVSEVDSIAEVVPCPEITAVPHSVHWFLGLSQLRGELLPIIDLQAFLLANNIFRNKFSRLLVITAKEENNALLVDRVYGIKRFVNNSMREIRGKLDSSILPYLNGSFINESGLWHVLDLKKIISAEKFNQLINYIK